MITSRRRDRTLVFRLNQSEYDRLIQAAMSRGDRSVSEFIRIAVMSAIGGTSAKGAAAPSQGSETLPRHPFCAGLLESQDRVQELEQRIQRLEEQLLAPAQPARD